MKHEAYLDLVLAVQLVVVQRILGDSCTCFVQVLDEGNVFLRRNETNFVQVGVPRKRQQQYKNIKTHSPVLREECHELILGDTLWKIL